MTNDLPVNELRPIIDLVDWISRHVPPVWAMGLVGSYARGQRGPDIDLALGLDNKTKASWRRCTEFIDSLSTASTPYDRRLLCAQLLQLPQPVRAEWLALERLDPWLLTAAGTDHGRYILQAETRYAHRLLRVHHPVWPGQSTAILHHSITHQANPYVQTTKNQPNDLYH